MDQNNTIQEAGTNRVGSRKDNKRRKKIWINILLFIISAAVWTALVYYGYTYAKGYIDTSIRNVQQQNAINIQQLTGRIEQMSQEISKLQESIEDADSNISSSKSVQRRIDDRLEELDDQLRELEKSLQILKEAPNVQN
jgi:septal ring factor EnvC (AmiA/AmiB activator)